MFVVSQMIFFSGMAFGTLRLVRAIPVPCAGVSVIIDTSSMSSTDAPSKFGGCSRVRSTFVSASRRQLSTPCYCRYTRQFLFFIVGCLSQHRAPGITIWMVNKNQFAPKDHWTSESHWCELQALFSVIWCWGLPTRNTVPGFHFERDAAIALSGSENRIRVYI